MQSNDNVKIKDSRYAKIKILYYPNTLYFECNAEKKKIMEYASSTGQSLRNYILYLIFEKEEPEILVDKQRKERRMHKNHVAKKSSVTRYELLVPVEKQDTLKKKAKKRNMAVSNYILARIRADLKEKGIPMDYHEPYQFLIFYKIKGEEQDNYANTTEEAMQIIERIKSEEATGILLVDTVNRTRKEF